MTAHVVTNRVVYTYQPEGWPVGLLTGFVDQANGFVLEHVVAFRRGVLLGMLRAGLAYAWAQGWCRVTFTVPAEHPLRDGLVAIGQRVGFTPYDPTHYVQWHP